MSCRILFHFHSSWQPCRHSAHSMGSSALIFRYPRMRGGRLEDRVRKFCSLSLQTTPQPNGADLLIDHVEVNPMTSSRIIRNTTLHNSYFIEDRVLGIGISGEVKLITSKTTGQKFALKSLSTAMLSKKRWNMLLDEIEIFLKMDHPNIYKLFEVYQDAVAIHLVMELIEGPELASRVKDGKALSEHEAASVCLQMLEILSYLHWHQVCHRDIKLEHWIYSDSSADAKLKLIDFGLSKRFSDLHDADMEGTTVYMAPEIWEGEFDEKCDIWAVGVIMYILLSGSLPFEGQARNEISRQIMMYGFPLSGPRWDAVSDLAKDFVSVLLETDPEDRPSAGEAMKHEWLKRMVGSADNAPDISVNLLRSLQDFAHQSAMRRVVCGVMAFNMSVDDVHLAEKQFRKLDTNGSGTITLDELTDVLKRRMRLTESQAQQIFQRLDQTGDQEIHYSEFLAAAVMSRSTLHKNVIREAFNKFDVEGKGYISLDDLRKVLGDEYGGIEVEDILSAADQSNNGFIEYEEFVEAVQERPPGSSLVQTIGDQASSSQDALRRASRRTLGRIARRHVWK